jgi:hypothetical protein
MGKRTGLAQSEVRGRESAVRGGRLLAEDLAECGVVRLADVHRWIRRKSRWVQAAADVESATLPSHASRAREGREHVTQINDSAPALKSAATDGRRSGRIDQRLAVFLARRFQAEIQCGLQLAELLMRRKPLGKRRFGKSLEF